MVAKYTVQNGLQSLLPLKVVAECLLVIQVHRVQKLLEKIRGLCITLD